MKKLKFDAVVGHAVSYDEHGTHPLPVGAISELTLRYVLNEAGEVVDQYAGLSDSEAVDAHAAKQQAENSARAAALAAEQAIKNATVTKLAYLRRFTQTERIAINASTDPIVQDFMALLNMAQEIVLTDPDTMHGTSYLEQAGLIGPNRAAEILAV